MKIYILKRIGFSLITLTLLVILVFFLQSLIKADPIPYNAKDPAQWKKAMAAAGLTDPLITQFWHYLTTLFSGSFGKLYGTNASVWIDVKKPILFSLILTIPAAFFSVVIGVPLGVIAANYRGKWPDILINTFTVIFMAVPAFAFVMYLTEWFQNTLPIQFRDPGLLGWGETIKSYILPVVALSFSGIAPFVYYTRNEMVEVLGEDYIQTAQTKGLKWKTVLWKHAIRNAMIPIITIILGTIFALISGSFVVEGIFNIPGVSGKIVNSISNREINEIMFIVIFFGSINFIGQLITDISYVFVDPRINYGSSTHPTFFRRAAAWKERLKDKRELAIELEGEELRGADNE